ncbi:MAG: hypothetical protein KBF73_07990 [Flavobacteriales bacterium]|nr:hypothetical protein [Flavobacteriales bacterium]
MPKLIFDTKENNNRRRQAEFLALTPAERVEGFLKMVGEYGKFGTKAKPTEKGNFVLEKSQDGV